MSIHVICKSQPFQIGDINSHTKWQTVQIQRSQLIWICTVCIGRAYPGSARLELMGLDTFHRFFLIVFTRDETFLTFCLHSCKPISSWKRQPIFRREAKTIMTELLPRKVYPVSLTHLSLEIPKRTACKQCRSDTAECGIWSGSPLFANRVAIYL